jgi:hypothetical protein
MIIPAAAVATHAVSIAACAASIAASLTIASATSY